MSTVEIKSSDERCSDEAVKKVDPEIPAVPATPDDRCNDESVREADSAIPIVPTMSADGIWIRTTVKVADETNESREFAKTDDRSTAAELVTSALFAKDDESP
jgi:hypothetical protein